MYYLYALRTDRVLIAVYGEAFGPGGRNHLCNTSRKKICEMARDESRGNPAVAFFVYDDPDLHGTRDRLKIEDAETVLPYQSKRVPA